MEQIKKTLVVVLMLVLLLTCTLFSSAYGFIRGTASASKLNTTNKYIYANESLPVNVFFSNTNTYNPLKTALLRWSKSKTGANFNYTYGGKTYGAITKNDIWSEVSFVNFNQISEIPASAKSAIALTIRTSRNYNNPDIYLNSNKKFGIGYCSYSGGWYDCEGIITHELGHVLGLTDLYNYYYVSSTMYGYFSLIPNNASSYNSRTLQADDIKGLKTMYP
ncbi:MAG: hypothetical protein ACD_26C00073G0001 [uncultured bacterium]|nr:MAG: hypothetical protein ACD_26C00073G0001 [uncultured bacterium]